MKRFCTTNLKNLFQPYILGSVELQNRMVMAAMTRCRADPKTGIPNEMHVQYYSERAEGTGLVLTECSSVSNKGNAFPGAAGIWTDEQVEGWKKVTEAVHDKGSKIYLQIWHGGRAARKMYTKEIPVGASNLPIRVSKNSDGSFKTQDVPEILSEDGITHIIQEFYQGALRAKKAGFDGLELHGANGYLVDQFLRDGINNRQDKFGGSIENRCRFALMTMEALTSVYGADRVGIKLSPIGRYGDMFDSNPIQLYTYLLKELEKKKTSFIELMRGPEGLPGENFWGVKGEDQIPDVLKTFRPIFNNTIIGNNFFNYEEGNKIIADGLVDLVSFGRPYIANPDLPKRYLNGWKLSDINFKNIYFGGKEGYIDYPKYQI
jgi:N-ethylmaleimide reductase